MYSPYRNFNDNDDLDPMNDEPLDLTDPNRIAKTQANYSNYQQSQSRTQDPVIMKITGILVILDMVAIAAFLAYLITLGDFNLDKQLPMIKSAVVPMYAIFLIDAIVIALLNKQFSVLLIALLLPVFYPLKRAYVTYDRKNLYSIWIVLTFVLCGFVLTNLYPQLYEKVLLIKNSADEYTSECDDAVKYLKGVKVDSGKMIIEVVREKFDDYVWKAVKNADGTYDIEIKGDTELKVEGAFATDRLLKNNTKFIIRVTAAMDKYTVTGFEINGEPKNQYINIAWAELCKPKA